MWSDLVDWGLTQACLSRRYVLWGRLHYERRQNKKHGKVVRLVIAYYENLVQ